MNFTVAEVGMGKPFFRMWIVVASVFLIILFDHLGFLEGTNQRLYDLSFRLRGPHPPSKEILLVVIHGETLKRLGQWPIRRLHYSSLLERLKQAKVVAFDITLSEPTGDDSLLAESIKRHGRVILPVHIDHQGTLVSPASTLGSFYRTGHVHLEGGVDGIVRDVYHTLVHRKAVIPSISSAVYEVVSRTPFQRMSPLPTDNSDKDIIQMDRMIINYCGPPGTFETLSFSDVLDGVYPPAFFNGKIVLVGIGTIGLGDQFLIPFSQNRNYMPGIEVQANCLNTLLMNNPIQVLPFLTHWLLDLLLALLSYLLFLKVPEKKAAVLGLTILAGMAITLYVLFSTSNLWLRPVGFYATILAVFWVTYVIKLEKAAQNLDRAYAAMLPQLRWNEKTREAHRGGEGVSGIFTPGGIESKVRVLADISHQLIFEKELADHVLLSHLHAVLLFGPDGKNVLVNEPAAAYCEANSLDRTTAERFLKGIDSYLLEKRSLEVLGPQEGHVTCMISLPLPEKRYIKVDAAPIDGLDGKYLLFILSDVTQVKELEILKEHLLFRKRAEEALRDSEERYRSLVENSTDMIFIAQDGLIRFSNPATLTTLGYCEKELAVLPLVEIIHPQDSAMVMERHQRRLHGEEVPNTCSFRILNKGGEELWVQLNSALITWEGRPGVLCFLRDITFQKRLETQYLKAQKMEAIGTLAGGIAHDFNNILSAILGYAELASLDIKEGTKAKYDLEQLTKAALRAKDLVQQILAFSRQGKQERKALNLKPIVVEGLKFLRASLPATIQIRQEIEENLGTIEADATQVHQVLLNLCTNAAHAMEEKGGVLEVSLSNSDVENHSAVSGEIASGSYVRLRVKDTGQGIASEILGRIFDPYFTTKEAGKGTGLGLAVVHGIVKNYGGGITVSSEVGRGSTFDIYFPRVEASDLPSGNHQVEPLPLGLRERVLFVDDEEEIVEIGREALEYLGYEVVAKTSSVEALELFRRQADRFDLVITDMTMPNMTGDRLAQELLRIRPEIPIILCTGFSEHITGEKARAMGIRELAIKPLVMSELAKVIRRALGHQKKKKD